MLMQALAEVPDSPAAANGFGWHVSEGWVRVNKPLAMNSHSTICETLGNVRGQRVTVTLARL